MLQPSRKPHDKAASAVPVPPRAWLMLAVATVGFAVNFWAWALLSPLGPRFKDTLALSSFQQSLLVAVPVVVGSLGRIPVGALTDRFGGRVMFPLVSAATILPVLYLGLAGHSSLTALLVGGFFLGVGGTAFAVGVPFVNAWFPPERRGLAIGLFGMGMGGTAISALTTVKLVKAHSTATPFLITAAVLALYAVVAALVLRDAPNRPIPTESLGRRLADTLRLGITWQASALYAVAFGGYVAFSVYLPTYLKNGYGLTQADAANRMAGFVLLAVAMRPIGGWLSDRIGPVRVLGGALAVVVGGALVQSLTPSLAPLGTIAFLAMAAALGAGSGATFALVALLAPPNRTGSVTGVVGAAGGLGGFVPPLVMGSLYGAYDSYAVGLMLLAAVAATALLFTGTQVRRTVPSHTPAAGSTACPRRRPVTAAASLTRPWRTRRLSATTHTPPQHRHERPHRHRTDPDPAPAPMRAQPPMPPAPRPEANGGTIHPTPPEPRPRAGCPCGPVCGARGRPGRSARGGGHAAPAPGWHAARTLGSGSPPLVARARGREVFLVRRPVVVGLDGSPESLTAADWAAREALRRGLPLRLLYAFEGLPSRASDLPELAAPRYWAGRVLRGAMDRLAETYPQVPLSAEQIARPAPEALLAAESEVLVLGNRAVSGFAGLLADSVGSATVARAPVPVVLVPAEYRHVTEAGTHRPVVVGVDTAHPCDEVLEFAFDAAAVRRAPLRAVHAWHPRHVPHGHASQQDSERALDAALGPWQEKYPNIDVHRIVDHGSAAQRLLHASADARLLVVGRRIRPVRLGPHIGPVAHAVLHHARCPVAIVPHE